MNCQKHGTPMTYEPGGVSMPTVLGRTYCRDCQREFIAALSGLTVEDIKNVGDVPAGASTSGGNECLACGLDRGIWSDYCTQCCLDGSADTHEKGVK